MTARSDFRKAVKLTELATSLRDIGRVRQGQAGASAPSAEATPPPVLSTHTSRVATPADVLWVQDFLRAVATLPRHKDNDDDPSEVIFPFFKEIPKLKMSMTGAKLAELFALDIGSIPEGLDDTYSYVDRIEGNNEINITLEAHFRLVPWPGKKADPPWWIRSIEATPKVKQVMMTEFWGQTSPITDPAFYPQLVMKIIAAMPTGKKPKIKNLRVDPNNPARLTFQNNSGYKNHKAAFTFPAGRPFVEIETDCGYATYRVDPAKVAPAKILSTVSSVVGGHFKMDREDNIYILSATQKFHGSGSSDYWDEWLMWAVSQDGRKFCKELAREAR